MLTLPVEEGGRAGGVPHLFGPGPSLSWFPLAHSLHLHCVGLSVMVWMAFTEPQGCLPCAVRAPHSLLWFTSPLHLLLAPLCGWFPWALRPPGLILVPPSSPLPSPLCHQWILCSSCSVCWARHSPCCGLAASEKSSSSETAQPLYSVCPLFLPLFPLRIAQSMGILSLCFSVPSPTCPLESARAVGPGLARWHCLPSD